MTIPQILSSVGWFLFILAGGVLALHTVNMLIPGVDFFIPSSRIGVIGFVIAAPLTLLGLVIGVAGFFGEQIEEYLLERERKQ